MWTFSAYLACNKATNGQTEIRHEKDKKLKLRKRYFSKFHSELSTGLTCVCQHVSVEGADPGKRSRAVGAIQFVWRVGVGIAFLLQGHSRSWMRLQRRRVSHHLGLRTLQVVSITQLLLQFILWDNNLIQSVRAKSSQSKTRMTASVHGNKSKHTRG